MNVKGGLKFASHSGGLVPILIPDPVMSTGLKAQFSPEVYPLGMSHLDDDDVTKK